MNEESHDVIVGYIGYRWGMNGKYQWYYCRHMDEEFHDVNFMTWGVCGVWMRIIHDIIVSIWMRILNEEFYWWRILWMTNIINEESKWGILWRENFIDWEYYEEYHHTIVSICERNIAAIMTSCAAVCCGVLRCIAVRCGVLRCVAVCCSVLQCVAVCCSVLMCSVVWGSVLQCAAACCSVKHHHEWAYELKTRIKNIMNKVYMPHMRKTCRPSEWGVAYI